MNCNILITVVVGGIVDKLKKHHQVIVYDSLIYEESHRKDVNFVYGDVRDQSKLLNYLKTMMQLFLGRLVGDGACNKSRINFEINSFR